MADGSTLNEAMLIGAFALAGTIIGGIITYLATRSSDNRKWKQEKEYRLKEYERAALAKALEWIDPMHNAISKATTLASSFVTGKTDQDELARQWPSLLSQLTEYDIDPRYRFFLPDGTYLGGFAIIRELDNLLTKTVFVGQLARLQKINAKEWENFLEQLSLINDKFETYRDQMIESYKETFT
jgi:uncharacterized membrane-anchored protein YhcB (DUF1043 family)